MKKINKSKKISKNTIKNIIGGIGIILIGLVIYLAATEDIRRERRIEELKTDIKENAEEIEDQQLRLECLNIIESKADENGNINTSDVPVKCRSVLKEFIK
ncbi:MAG: hypothetical protein RBQ97_06810 [Acholeplasma sp.]|nr:hypothetical protein [Acholeplasma sp.]